MFKPESIQVFATENLNSRFEQSTICYAKPAAELRQKGWRFYVVAQSRGRCYHDYKVITIPAWAWQSSKHGYAEWYVCHEIAHAYAGHEAKHGKVFMRELIRLCPAEFIHWEIGYKPRNVIAAGAVFCPDSPHLNF